MNKKIYILILTLVLNCAKDKGKLDDLDAPKWAFDPYITMSKDDRKIKIAASGMACATESGLRVQIQKADADARLSMAKQIGVEINSSLEDYVKETSSSEKQIIEFKKNFEAKSQEIIDHLPISGSYRTDIWQSTQKTSYGKGCDEMLFVRMEVDREKITDYLSKSLDDYSKGVKDRNFAKNFKEKAINDFKNQDK